MQAGALTLALILTLTPTLTLTLTLALTLTLTLALTLTLTLTLTLNLRCAVRATASIRPLWGENRRCGPGWVPPSVPDLLLQLSPRLVTGTTTIFFRSLERGHHP